MRGHTGQHGRAAAALAQAQMQVEWSAREDDSVCQWDTRLGPMTSSRVEEAALTSLDMRWTCEARDGGGQIRLQRRTLQGPSSGKERAEQSS